MEAKSPLAKLFPNATPRTTRSTLEAALVIAVRALEKQSCGLRGPKRHGESLCTCYSHVSNVALAKIESALAVGP